jgi:hypothetical protein
MGFIKISAFTGAKNAEIGPMQGSEAGTHDRTVSGSDVAETESGPVKPVKYEIVLTVELLYCRAVKYKRRRGGDAPRRDAGNMLGFDDVPKRLGPQHHLRVQGLDSIPPPVGSDGIHLVQMPTCERRRAFRQPSQI